LAAWLAEKVEQPVVADNRPGAGTAIAHTLAAKATPDGYTLILGSSSGLGTNPAFGGKLEYHPLKDFEPIGLAAYVPQLIVVHPSVPAKDLQAFIDLSKAQPDKISFGSPGAGSLGHLCIALINSMSGSRFLHVPYKGAAPATLDVIGGRIQAFLGSVTGTQALVQSGKVRALATGHLKRLSAMPDLPTVGETLPGFHGDGWYGLLGPAGTPAPIVKKVHAEMQRALANADFIKHVEKIGMVPTSGSPHDLREFVRNELARWTKAVRDAKLQPPA
jgi:tripartite-type tricarboxylate transporter receptor subunit TctC